VEEYYSKIKRCNEIVKYSEDFLWHEFIEGLTPENKICAENIKSRPTFDELVERLIQELRVKDHPDQSGAVITSLERRIC
jgi:hypothetical protein